MFRSRLLNGVCFAPEGTTTTDGATTTATVTTTAVTDTGHPRIDQLRADLAAERTDKANLERKLTTELTKAKEDLVIAKAEVETKVTTEVGKITAKLTKMQQRVVDAELKAKATELQLADPDLLLHPLLDRSKIIVDDDGNVTGVAEAFAALKEKKPDWFKAPATTTTTTTTARTTGAASPTTTAANTSTTTDVRKMTPAEYEAHKLSLRRGLRVAAG